MSRGQLAKDRDRGCIDGVGAKPWRRNQGTGVGGAGWARGIGAKRGARMEVQKEGLFDCMQMGRGIDGDGVGFVCGGGGR